MMGVLVRDHKESMLRNIMWKFKGDSRGKRPVKDQGDSVGRLIRRMTRDMILLKPYLLS